MADVTVTAEQALQANQAVQVAGLGASEIEDVNADGTSRRDLMVRQFRFR